MGAQRVFIAFGQAITPGIAEQQLSPIGQKGPGKPIHNNPPNDGCSGFFSIFVRMSLTKSVDLLLFIVILPEHTPFLGCSWVVDGQHRFYQFTVLPFGLSTGPYIFTKVQQALTKHWRSQGIWIFTYLDDGAGADSTFSEAH